MKNKIIKFTFIVLNILFVIPSIMYLIKYKTVVGFNAYNNFFLEQQYDHIVASITYLVIFILLMILYSVILKKKMFKNIKEILIFVTIIGGIYLCMVPWTSSDIFYYMGVGELDSVYNQNPYYVTMQEYYNANKDNINDEILECGTNNCWASTTVVYGTIAQMIFAFCSAISFKNATFSIFVFKLVNLIVHIFNCYIIYKLCKKKVFSVMYGLNPFILLELIGNVHNDVFIIFFVLLSLFFIIKKKNIILSIIFLALATGIKYFTVLLLPIILLYNFKDEENIFHKILKIIKYLILFLLIYLIEYIPYFEDINILFASFPQVDRYTKSIYSALMLLCRDRFNISVFIRYGIVLIFLSVSTISYIKFLFNKNNKISKMLKEYNTILIFAVLILSNLQIWYFSWFFCTIIWQKRKCQCNIIAFSAIAEIANSIFMISSNQYREVYYIIMINILFLLWNLFLNYIDRNRKKHNNISLSQP